MVLPMSTWILGDTKLTNLPSIWEWRQNNWRFTHDPSYSLPGGSVPDRDLWELLDYIVRQYELIEYVVSESVGMRLTCSCNCRFWHIPSDANHEAVQLAEIGAVRMQTVALGLAYTYLGKKESAVHHRALDKEKKYCDSLRHAFFHCFTTSFHSCSLNSIKPILGVLPIALKWLLFTRGMIL